MYIHFLFGRWTIGCGCAIGGAEVCGARLQRHIDMQAQCDTGNTVQGKPLVQFTELKQMCIYYLCLCLCLYRQIYQRLHDECGRHDENFKLKWQPRRQSNFVCLVLLCATLASL